MGYPSSRGSTETSPSIWRRSKLTRAAWWSFVTKCEDILASHGTPPNRFTQPFGVGGLSRPRRESTADSKVNRAASIPFLTFELIESVRCFIQWPHEKDTTRIVHRYRQLTWLKP